MLNINSKNLAACVAAIRHVWATLFQAPPFFAFFFLAPPRAPPPRFFLELFSRHEFLGHPLLVLAILVFRFLLDGHNPQVWGVRGLDR